MQPEFWWENITLKCAVEATNTSAENVGNGLLLF